MFEDISCCQLTSLSSSKHLRDFVLWHLSRENHQQTHIKLCDVQIRFNVCDSGSPESIKSHHFMNFSWLRYQIPNGHCISKTSDCVYDHYLLISTPIFFILEVLWRHNSRLAMTHSSKVPCHSWNSTPTSFDLDKLLKRTRII